MSDTLGEKLFDLEARIEGVFPLVVGDPEGAPEWLEDFCDYADSASRSVFERFPTLAPLIEDDRIPYPDEVADTLSGGVFGWVCRISWFPREYLDSNIFQSGWGLTRTAYTWGETADDAVAAALVLVSENHDRARTKAAA